jgi:type 1 glutamine amidotransferase
LKLNERQVKTIFLLLFGSFNFVLVYSQLSSPQNLRILVLAESGGHHIEFTRAAKPWLNRLATEKQFSIDYVENTDMIDSLFLSNYQLVLQLDYPPYGWPQKAVKAFEDYINNGTGGWVGLHHATLLGEFDGYPMWSWFSNFMGGIRFKNYIPTFASGEVYNEDSNHPVMKDVPEYFTIEGEEWYTYDKSPRPNVKVLASVNEKTYSPDSPIKMGDHPVVWTNTNVRARNVYIFMGHSPNLFNNSYFLTLFKNAIIWTSSSK